MYNIKQIQAYIRALKKINEEHKKIYLVYQGKISTSYDHKRIVSIIYNLTQKMIRAKNQKEKKTIQRHILKFIQLLRKNVFSEFRFTNINEKELLKREKQYDTALYQLLQETEEKLIEFSQSEGFENTKVGKDVIKASENIAQLLEEEKRNVTFEEYIQSVLAKAEEYSREEQNLINVESTYLKDFEFEGEVTEGRLATLNKNMLAIRKIVKEINNLLAKESKEIISPLSRFLKQKRISDVILYKATKKPFIRLRHIEKDLRSLKTPNEIQNYCASLILYVGQFYEKDRNKILKLISKYQKYSKVIEERQNRLEKARLEVERKHFSEMAGRDALTGLYNRRRFNEKILINIKHADRHQIGLGLLILDIDHFKSFNDEYSHQIGDEVLIFVSSILQEASRDAELFRIGGEEFAVIFQNSDLKGTMSAANRIKTEVEKGSKVILSEINNRKEFLDKPENKKRQVITISGGVACFIGLDVKNLEDSEIDDIAENLFELADFALLNKAKKYRNRIESGGKVIHPRSNVHSLNRSNKKQGL